MPAIRMNYTEMVEEDTQQLCEPEINLHLSQSVWAPVSKPIKTPEKKKFQIP